MNARWIILAVLLGACALAQAESGTAERPLPLASNWNCGGPSEGFTPQWQMEMIEKGHHLILTLGLGGPDAKFDARSQEKWIEPLRKAREKRMPISLLTGEWESTLYSDPKYRAIPGDDNPCVVEREGDPQKMVSPFGPVKWWSDVGRRYTDCEFVRKLEEIYPDPPYVVIVADNEAAKLDWPIAEKDRRYRAKYGDDKSDDLKKKIVGDGYLERYRAMLDAARQGFRAWRGRVILTAYGASPLIEMGQSRGWRKATLWVEGRPAIDPYIWDGMSPSQYITTWDANSDYSMNSPQACAMNLVVQERLFRKARPMLFSEVSVWDGAYDGRKTAVIKLKKWAAEGQKVPPERYGGMVKWVMWMPRASIVRDYRWWHEPRQPQGQFPGMEKPYAQVIAAVDQVHQYPLLARFWREGALVANPAHQHPYQYDIPDEVKSEPRWFQLDSSANPPWPWDLNTPVHVWSFAYVMGREPAREWMVYTFAPLGTRPEVEVQLPGYGPVKLSASQSGSYFHVVEKEKNVVPVVVGNP